MTIGVVGAGAWGTTLAYLASNNSDVLLYAREPERARHMQKTRINERYLPNLLLPENIQITSKQDDLQKVDVVIFAVPSIGFREAIQDFSFLDKNIPYVSVTKGLEKNTNMRMSQVILDQDKNRDISNQAVLAGPNLAHEIVKGLPAATVIASDSLDLAGRLQSVFMSRVFRVYTSQDVTGCEISGVAKNVVAIAAGIGDGFGYGDNAKATVMTRGLAEIIRLGTAEGGKQTTFSGLAGIGDLIATCASPLSRNRTVGFQLGQGKTLQEIQSDTIDIAEGIFSAHALCKRAEKLNIEMPIARAVANVVDNGRVTSRDVELLMTRPAVSE